MLKDAPPSVQPQPGLVGRKSADPITILTISVSIWLLLQNPFSKKFAERIAERTADCSLDLLSWLKDQVFARFSRLEREALFEFDCEYKGCRVQFVVPSKDPSVLEKSAETVGAVGKRAVALINSP